jgi:hypothetical protein
MTLGDTPLPVLLGAVTGGNVPLAALLLDALPDEVGAAAPALHHAAVRAAPRGAAELLLAAGADPTHVALWEGFPEQVAALLSVPHDLAHRNGTGGDALETLLHGAEHARGPGRDHAACARALLSVGVRVPEALLDEVADEALRVVLSAGVEGDSLDV